MKRELILIAVAMSSLVGCGGSSGPGISADAGLSLDRDPVALPAAYVGTTQIESLQIINGSNDLVTITSVALVAIDGGVVLGADAGGVFTQPLIAVDAGTDSDPLPVQIGRLQVGFLQFSYSPRTHGESLATLVIQSNAAADSTLTATVSACAVALDAGMSDSGVCD